MVPFRLHLTFFGGCGLVGDGYGSEHGACTTLEGAALESEAMRSSRGNRTEHCNATQNQNDATERKYCKTHKTFSPQRVIEATRERERGTQVQSTAVFVIL